MDPANDIPSTTSQVINITNIYNSNIANIIAAGNGAENNPATITGDTTVSNRFSINNFGKVTPRFIECESYLEAKRQQREKDVSVLHLQGIPGSGKSSIVKKLAEDFPYITERVFVKWHIECCDVNHDIKTQLKKLLEQMFQREMISVQEAVLKSSMDNLMARRCQEYLDLLVSSNISILIIIEDPGMDDKGFLCDFFSCINYIQTREDKKFHVYVTSKSKKVCDFPNSPRFFRKQICGLAVAEGLKLLEVNELYDHGEKNAATEIIKKLSGSPLGLIAVKAARKSSTSFKEYLEHLQHETLVHGVIEREKQNLENTHLHKAILILLKPGSEKQNAAKQWKAIACLAMVHHGNIPQTLIGRVMQHLRSREESTEECNMLNKAESDDFVEQFEDYGLCEVTGNGYKKRRVTFHEVVFFAVRLYLKGTGENVFAKRTMIQCLAGIVHKDLRKPQVHEFMTSMLPHMRSMLKHQVSTSDRLLQFCRGHLYEVFGTVIGKQFAGEDNVKDAESQLRKSIEIWFEILRSINGSIISHDTALEPLVNETLEDRAKLIVDECAEAGRKLQGRNDFDIEKYISIVLQLKLNEIAHYNDQSNGELGSGFKQIAECGITLNPSNLRRLRDKYGQLFLARCKLYETYLAERIASVLHTLSGLIKTYHGAEALEVRPRFKLFATVGLAICEEVQRRYNFAPIFLRLTAHRSVGIRLKSLKRVDVVNRRTILIETKTFIQLSLMQAQNLLIYEHGISKVVENDAFEGLKHKSSIVRINAKLLSLGPGEGIDINEADTVCEELHQKATDNTVWEISPKCLVYCGKYWASRGQYDKAIQHFDNALERLDSHGRTQTSRSYPWACYNLARAVVLGEMRCRAENSKMLCERVLENRRSISRELVENLERLLGELDNMLS